jgi:hypothetical protein
LCGRKAPLPSAFLAGAPFHNPLFPLAALQRSALSRAFFASSPDLAVHRKDNSWPSVVRFPSAAGDEKPLGDERDPTLREALGDGVDNPTTEFRRLAQL